MNLTINQHPQTNFKANIYQTRYLKSGFEAAVKLAEQGKAEDSFTFYKAISNIKNNSNISQFHIINTPKTIISIDGYDLELRAQNKLDSLQSKTEGEDCLYSVINFAKKVMGMDLLTKSIPTGREIVEKLNSLKKSIFEAKEQFIEDASKDGISEFRYANYLKDRTTEPQSFEKLQQQYRKDPNVDTNIAMNSMRNSSAAITEYNKAREGIKYEPVLVLDPAIVRENAASKLLAMYKYEVSQHLKNGLSIEEIAKLYNESTDWVKSVIAAK